MGENFWLTFLTICSSCVLSFRSSACHHLLNQHLHPEWRPAQFTLYPNRQNKYTQHKEFSYINFKAKILEAVWNLILPLIQCVGFFFPQLVRPFRPPLTSSFWLWLHLPFPSNGSRPPAASQDITSPTKNKEAAHRSWRHAHTPAPTTPPSQVHRTDNDVI